MIKTTTTQTPRGAVFFSPATWMWHWARTYAPLTFDECEDLGLDGTGRSH
jgi:hypothetical protein